ncbi:hypothetical protein KB206_03465 [Microvirga sp. STS02]|uniref:MAC/perforin domain-containing protein n=1 Tax=Hymenobacter negativus TaxID=2795026 RepID=UPI0018DDD6A1|nr:MULTISPECIES: MAC/perforin domain-containing protein [Bacteria]MBH8567925.1 hypothetical protein [Hymenobacter negativus]MBR7207661.1 hypothetical protein [Microvirga sp. STS02]
MPNSNETTMINGSGVLGAGINMYGPFDGTLLNQVYDMSSGTETKQFPSKTTPVRYTIPANARFKESTDSNSYSDTYNTREEYDSHFAASANVKGSYLGFSASADASFKRDVNNKTSSSFGVLTFYTQPYDLELKNDSVAALTADLKNSAEYKAIPDVYDPAQPKAFLRFFRRFGTHFVSGVKMGANLKYSVAVHSSASITSEEMKAKLDAEYKGVFAKGSASASTEFKTADKKWFDSTQRHVSVKGGSSRILASVLPTVNENHNDAFEQWLDSVNAGATAVLSVQVQSIDHIFEGDKQAAVRDALKDYARQYIEFNLSNVTGRLRVAGKEVCPEQFSQPVVEAPRYSGLGRLEVAVLNPENLDIIYANSWTPTPSFSKVDFFAPALAELKRFQGTNNILLVGMASMFSARALMLDGGTAFADFLQANCGAGEGLTNYFHERPFGSDGPPNARTNYALISRFGASHPGIERYAEPPKMRGGSMMTFPKALDLYAFLNPHVNGQGKLSYEVSEMGLPPFKVKAPAKRVEEKAAAEQKTIA